MKPAILLPLALASLAWLSLAGCAATPQPMTAQAVEPAPECDVTGSRIRSKEAQCVPKGYPFRSYSMEELQSTGRIDLAEQLRVLDPAFQ